MSRAHPIGLRIASKTLNPSFIGVGKYYSYNQLKYNIVISKSIKQLSKQLVIPACKIINRLNYQNKNTKNEILYSSILPINIQLKAKQLFDSQYVLNRRRLYSVAIYITRLLKQQFEKNYNDFTENTYAKPYLNITREKKTHYNLNSPVVSLKKHLKWKLTRLKSFFLCPTISFAQNFFRVSQKASLNFYDVKISLNNLKISKKHKQILFEASKENSRLRTQLLTVESDPYLLLSYGVSFLGMQNFSYAWQKLKKFYFLIKKSSLSIKQNPNVNNLYPLIKDNNSRFISVLTLNDLQMFSFNLKKKQNKSLDHSQVLLKKIKICSFNFCLNKSKYLHGNYQKLENSKKCKNCNILRRSIFFNNFFQYLILKNSKVFCPEWPLSVNFSKTILSINHSTNRQQFLSSIGVKTKIKKIPSLIKQNRKTTFIKTKVVNLKYFFNHDSAVTFPKHWTLRDFLKKPEINYQIIKRYILLNYLSRLRFINKPLYKTTKLEDTHKPIYGTSLALAKELKNRQKRLYISSVSFNKREVFQNLRPNKVSYVVCPRATTIFFNLKSIKKFTQQIENFRSDIKILASLGLLLHRSFSEPVGIHCISALDNRLEKEYCNPFLKNLLFKRTSDSFLKSNYMNPQMELLRQKNNILFDFAYTKDSLLKLGLKKTSPLMQQQLEAGHTALWLRKISSIRL